MPADSRADHGLELAAQGVSPAPEGVLYACSGDYYVAEALRSARSSLRFNKLPHLLITSGEAGASAGGAGGAGAGGTGAGEAAGVEGLSVAHYEPSQNPYADKIANMRRSPFERTLYLDSDTYVVDEIAHVLGLLDHYDLAVAYAPAYRGLADPQVPAAFYEFNTGVLAWRASERVAEFMRDWEATYLAWLEDEPFAGATKASRGGRADQPAFRRCAWQHGLSVFVLAPEYNLRLGYPTTVVDRVRVIHGNHEDFEALAARINASERPRTWPPPLTPREKVERRVRKAAGLAPKRPKNRPGWRADAA